MDTISFTVWSVIIIIANFTLLPTGFFYLLGGRFSPKHSSFLPKNFSQLNLTKSYNVLAKNLSAISQLQRPRNCLRMPQNHSQKAQNSKKILGGIPPDPPRELRPMPATPIHCHFQHLPPPKPKILDRTLTAK